MKDRARFEAIRKRYMAAVERERTYRLDVLLPKYARLNPDRYWMTSGEIARLERMRAAQNREGEKMFALLDRIGGRYWRSGAPYAWIMESLTFEDAITRDALSTVPPTAYGQAESDMRRFAAAVAS